jgi:hypothetical protein
MIVAVLPTSVLLYWLTGNKNKEIMDVRSPVYAVTL